MVNCINTVNGPVWSRLINLCNVYLYVNFMYICMYICTGMYICMYSVYGFLPEKSTHIRISLRRGTVLMASMGPGG